MISTIAACLGNRVWVEKFEGNKMYANLYVMLLGPSAIGKGIAIDFATEHIHGLAAVNEFRGKTTGAYLADIIASPKRQKGQPHDGATADALLYLITPELSESVGEGPVARDFIKRLTSWFTGGKHTLQEGTRTAGGIESKAPTVGWLSGTTMDWLLDCVRLPDITSGFFGRIMPIMRDYDFEAIRLYSRPKIPHDAKKVKRKISRTLEHICDLEGRLKLSNSAREIQDRWHRSRELPQDPGLMATYMRADDMVHKVSLCLAVADNLWNEKKMRDWRVHGVHFSRAIRLVEREHRCMPEVIRLVSSTRETADCETVAGFIKLAGRIPHAVLARRVSSRGIASQKMREHIQALHEQGRIEIDHESENKTYTWKTRAAIF